MKYEIFEGNMERLEAKLTRIANKCRKYGCSFTYEKTGETYRELTDPFGRKYTARFIQVEAEGTAVMNGWQFVASVEHTEKGNIINRTCIVEVPARYHFGQPVCEHCKSRRARKHTYIVRNTESGEFRQVGRSCLQDFTHGLSAEAAAEYISLYECLIEGSAPPADGTGERYIDIREALQFIAETVDKFGYVRTQENRRSTADRAYSYYAAEHGWLPERLRDEARSEMERAAFDPGSPKAQALADEALSWILEQDETNNYMHNLKTVCSLPYVRYKNFGILASLFPSYDRERAYKARKEAEAKAAEENASRHVGAVKDRITIAVASVECVASWDGDFGTTRIYKIVGTDGNVYIWKTGNVLDAGVKTIIGTVKAHTDFRGVKQTEVTRCRAA